MPPALPKESHIRPAKLLWPVHLVYGLFCVIGCCLFLMACEKRPPLRIGLMPWPGYQSLQLAKEKGFFTAEGADVRLLTFSSLGDTRRAFERRQIDAMCCTLVELLTTYEHSDRKPRAVFVIDFSEGADVIIAHAPISRVEDLKNRVVGAEPATIHTVVLARALQQAGLSLNDVRVRPIAVANMPMAFARKEIDAVADYRPSSRELLRQPGARVIFSSESIPREIIDVLAVGSGVLQTRRSDVLAVVRGLDRALQYSAAHPGESAQVMSKFEGTTPEEFRADLGELRIISAKEQAEYFTAGGPLEQAIGRTADVLRTVGQIHTPLSPDAVMADLFIPANKR